MSLENEIMLKLKDAMKAKDESALRGLRAIKAALLLLKTSGVENITPEDEIKMLQKMVKQRQDALDIFTQQNRADLAQKEAEEIKIIEQFLPQQLSAEALTAALKEIIQTVGAAGPGDLGKVMGIASKQLAGKADGKRISEATKALLTA
ncbi:MAG: GatB/YqeY domain-containing protein [Bacteroidetes bacterium]|nr:GatB/YqeY domain-containing protein [Bacteroidota bacterium]